MRDVADDGWQRVDSVRERCLQGGQILIRQRNQRAYVRDHREQAGQASRATRIELRDHRRGRCGRPGGGIGHRADGSPEPGAPRGHRVGSPVLGQPIHRFVFQAVERGARERELAHAHEGLCGGRVLGLRSRRGRLPDGVEFSLGHGSRLLAGGRHVPVEVRYLILSGELCLQDGKEQHRQVGARDFGICLAVEEGC